MSPPTVPVSILRKTLWALAGVVVLVLAMVVVSAALSITQPGGTVVGPGVVFRPSNSSADLQFSSSQTFSKGVIVRATGVTLDDVVFDVVKLPKGFPRAGVLITAWAPAAGNGTTAIEFIATSDPGTTVWFNVSGLRGDAVYRVLVDGVAMATSSTAGNVSFSWSTWSSHTFDLVTYVDTAPPVADAGVDQGGVVNQTFTFNGLASHDDTGITRYLWDFGDGASATGAIVNHSYAAGGQYTVTLTVWDGVDNSASDRTSVVVVTSGPDTVPPAQVTDLHASSWGPNYVVLEWTAPGDDGNVGQASVYEVRFATSMLNGTNFANGTQVYMAAPQPGGTPERLNVTSLSPDTRYWFALRTADEVPLWSPTSNAAEVLTLASWVGVPSIDSIGFDLTPAQVEIVFSEPMNHTSVDEALTITPSVPFGTTWENDTRVTVVMYTPLAANTTYKMTIQPHATDSDGIPLAKTFTFTFNGLPNSEAAQGLFGVPTPLVIPMLVSIAGLAAISMLAAVRSVRSQQKIVRLQSVVMTLARRMTAVNLANHIRDLRGQPPPVLSGQTRRMPRFRTRK